MGFSFGCSSETSRNITCHTYMPITKVKWQSIQFLTEHFWPVICLRISDKLVVAWIEIHQEDLLADWDLAVNGKKPFPIKGLDQ